MPGRRRALPARRLRRNLEAERPPDVASAWNTWFLSQTYGFSSVHASSAFAGPGGSGTAAVGGGLSGCSGGACAAGVRAVRDLEVAPVVVADQRESVLADRERREPLVDGGARIDQRRGRRAAPRVGAVGRSQALRVALHERDEAKPVGSGRYRGGADKAHAGERDGRGRARDVRAVSDVEVAVDVGGRDQGEPVGGHRERGREPHEARDRGCGGGGRADRV